MKIIDSDDYAASGIETMFFPGGEPHVKVPLFEEPLLLHLKLRAWTNVAFAACLQNALLAQGTSFKAFIPYFPGARQDRTDGTAPLTVRIMVELLGYTKTFVFDPHSSILIDHSDSIRALMPKDLNMRSPWGVAGIIAPDAGAHDRAISYRNRYAPEVPVLECSKVRNPQTGALSHFNMPLLHRAGRYIIVDDICDGGGTFNLLAGAFAKDPFAADSELEMFVSHGIFSKGVNAISPIIKKITTTDSWCKPSRSYSRLTVIPLLPELLPHMTGD